MISLKIKFEKKKFSVQATEIYPKTSTIINIQANNNNSKQLVNVVMDAHAKPM